MKAIAEYFRDLAAEDRYFGAEPPTPDAAMLHKIAEREIQRRVEAKIQENGVILRAGEIEVQAMPAPGARPAGVPATLRAEASAAALHAAAPQIAPKPASSAQPAEAAPTATAQTAAPSPVANASVATPATKDNDPATEARLSRIRNAVNQAREEAAVAPAVAKPVLDTTRLSAALVDYVEDEVAPADFIPEPDATLLVPRDIAVPDFDLGLEDEGIDDGDFAEADFAQGDFRTSDALETEDFGEDFVLENAAEPVAESDDAEDDLSGVLAAIATETALTEGPAALAGPAVAAMTEASVETDLAENDEDDDLAGMLTGIDFSTAEEDLAEATPETAEIQPETEAGYDDEEAAYGLDLAEADDLVLEDDLGLENDVAESAVDLDIDLSALNGRDLSADLSPNALHDAAAIAAETVEDEPEQDQEDAFAGIAAALTATPEQAASPARPTNERLERARARVIRIRRNPPVSASPAEDAVATTPAMQERASALSAEAEADLMRELAEVRAEAALAPADDGSVAPRRVRPVRPVRPVRSTSGPVTPPPATALGGETGEESVSRLLAETNSQMDGPENRRRLAAIQHLKAAVAATVAERRAGLAKPANPVERQDPYRADLSQIVHGDGEAVANRPSPLVLVSEQRIDRRPTQVTPVAAEPVTLAADAAEEAVQAPAASVATLRPQRLSSGAAAAAARLMEPEDDEDLDDEDAGNIFEDNQGFAEFADRLGAQGLPALLEAAAAYAACVEGRPHFSRPQIMRQIANTESGADSSREDGLRSFGRLLRDGTIVKVRRGHYALTERSHYLVEARKLVG
ncbi:hypothetical protein [Gemmobacter serpentinus]|uniref:hypothetical protein n=1 Tax=Gemmobacter serpentinus TaxID=2652247 RepID=UPI00124DA6DB|nr:hypothetical protein [Gemmobacter serpentinus]